MEICPAGVEDEHFYSLTVFPRSFILFLHKFFGEPSNKAAGREKRPYQGWNGK